MIKLFCKKSDSPTKRKVMAAKMYMFECMVGDDLVLLPESKAPWWILNNNSLYRTIAEEYI